MEGMIVLMRKIVISALVCAMLLTVFTALTSCGKKEDKLVCGVTDFEPMNYLDSSGNWTGFDTEFALLVGKKINMEVVFQEIEWGSKYSELASGAINCIWNGFTANTADSDDGVLRTQKVDFSYSYMLNQQCIVIRASRAGEFTSISDLHGKTAAAEKGSAGEAFAGETVGEAGTVIDSAAQVDTFREVKSGAVDCAVVDIILARQLAGSGDYSDLIIADIELDSEVYAVGFKKGSSLTKKVNDAMKALYDDGSLMELAKKYGLENTLILDTTFKS